MLVSLVLVYLPLLGLLPGVFGVPLASGWWSFGVFVVLRASRGLSLFPAVLGPSSGALPSCFVLYFSSSLTYSIASL